MLDLGEEKVREYIKTIGLYRNKAKNVIALSQKLIDDFGGEVPQSREELITLPGVGRKTAHVVASVLHDQPRMAVDTHVFRVSKRLGLVDEKAKTPLAVEQQLVKHIPEEYISKAHHWLILHGRYICLARKPKCETCPLTSFCHYFAQTTVA